MAVAEVQRYSFSTQIDEPRREDPEIGVLKSNVFRDGVFHVYLQDKLYKITDKKGSEPRIACVISLLSNLEYEPDTQWETLKQEKRIGALHVQNGEIKSLTLMPEQIQMMNDNGVNEIAFKVNQTLLIIKETMLLREYTSEEEYQQFTHLKENFLLQSAGKI